MLPDAEPLLEIRDAHHRRPEALTEARHLHEAMPVGVRLEDRDDLRGPDVSGDHAVVVRERAEIDLEVRRTEHVFGDRGLVELGGHAREAYHRVDAPAAAGSRPGRLSRTSAKPDAARGRE